MTELFDLTAAEAVQAMRDGRLTSTALTESLLARIDQQEDRLRAWVTVDRAGALAAAAARDAEAAAGQARGPLHGVPIAVKDIIAVAGLPNTAAFPPYRNAVPREDAAIVSRLRAAGATVLGKTVTTQFAFVDPPPTANPWNLERTPGGSSSGSGAAVGARQVPIALGTQTVGSVLRPAAYNGAVGFKPTYGRVSRQGIYPLAWSLDHPGWICRSVEDAAIVLAAVAGPDARDRTTSDRPVGSFPGVSPRPPRLRLIEDFLDRSAPAVRSHLAEIVDRLRGVGAEIQPIRLPEQMLDLLLDIQQVILLTEAAAVHAGQIDRFFDDYAPIIRSNIQVGTVIPGAAYLHAQRVRRQVRDTVLGLLGDSDAFLTPTISDEAPDRSATGDRTPQAPWSLLGTPSLALPSGLGPNGLPLSIQLIGRHWRDMELLGVAAWCEQVLGRLSGPPIA